VGEWHFRKGLHLLFRAWDLAFPKSNQAALTIKTNASCPFESPREDIRIIKQKLSVSELESMYLEHDCYLSASLGEGLGLPIAEALQAELPVCTNFWGGHTSLLQKGGFFELPHKEIVQPFCSLPELYALDQTCCFCDPKEIAKTLLRVVASSDEEREKMASRAAGSFAENFGLEAAKSKINSRLECHK